MHRTRTAFLAVAAGLTLVLTACGSDAPDDTSSAAGSTSGISTDHNDADIAFINDMTPHHEGAVMMSELAADRADSSQVQELADRISGAQEPELSRMQDMAEAWGVELDSSGGGHGGGHGGMSMDSMMGSDSEALMGLDGAEFDRAFLTRMIAHHEGALPMSEAELADGQNPQAQELAQEISTTQKAEIAEMEQLLTDL